MHEYTSTACLHNMHKECRLSCKFCKIRCKCGCHKHDPKLLDELDPPAAEGLSLAYLRRSLTHD